ncbi:hypothetical protein [Streptomyces collinus]
MTPAAGKKATEVVVRAREQVGITALEARRKLTRAVAHLPGWHG